MSHYMQRFSLFARLITEQYTPAAAQRKLNGLALVFPQPRVEVWRKHIPLQRTF
jgi:hypothetical protein